ncbi:Hypothetical protein A7982_02650 [Minicystis rosea]|nr:Hypothetical protein A7982_02650 [Minicystis rosea]
MAPVRARSRTRDEAAVSVHPGRRNLREKELRGELAVVARVL